MGERRIFSHYHMGASPSRHGPSAEFDPPVEPVDDPDDDEDEEYEDEVQAQTRDASASECRQKTLLNAQYSAPTAESPSAAPASKP